MKIYLSPKVRIQDIKNTFKNEFPYLKIEFFKRKGEPGEGKIRELVIPDSTSIMELTGLVKGEIEILPSQKVKEVEQIFQSEFNLPVHIFRKAKRIWVDTTKTGYLSLEKQNIKSMFGDEVILY